MTGELLTSSKCSGSGASIKVGDRRNDTSKSSLSESRLYMDIEDDDDDSSTSLILMIFFRSMPALLFLAMDFLISTYLSILVI